MFIFKGIVYDCNNQLVDQSYTFYAKINIDSGVNIFEVNRNNTIQII